MVMPRTTEIKVGDMLLIGATYYAVTEIDKPTDSYPCTTFWGRWWNESTGSWGCFPRPVPGATNDQWAVLDSAVWDAFPDLPE
jgi:hypothetical protein